MSSDQIQADLFAEGAPQDAGPQNSAAQESLSLQQTLDYWVEKGAVRALDLAFVRFIHQTLSAQGAGLSSDGLWLALLLASERTGHGHVCLDLSTLSSGHGATYAPVLLSRIQGEEAAAKIQQQLSRLLSAVSLPQLLDELRECPAVTCLLSGAADDGNATPLILTGSLQQPLLYLRRYWQYEQDVMAGIRQRLQVLTGPQHKVQQQVQQEAQAARALALLETIFAEGDGDQQPNWQKIACSLSSGSGFSIITGGPGTGKTTTVVRLLALLQGLQLAEGAAPRVIRLAAPTGKAAARLNESIAGSVQQLKLRSEWLTKAQCEQWQASIPTEVSTLHRLLGSQPNSRHFRHNRANPLPADIVVVDEASMVDVEMMAKLMDALRPDARLILLGDKDQLASVEAGSVLGDLCQQAEAGGYWPETCARVRAGSGQQIDAGYQTEPSAQPALLEQIAQATTMLRFSYRAKNSPGILSFARWVNQQGIERDGPGALAQFFTDYPDELQQIALKPSAEALAEQAAVPTADTRARYLKADQRDWSAFNQLVRDGYRPYLKMLQQQPAEGGQALDAWVLALFEQHKSFQLLSAVRQGEFGVEGLNLRIRQLLAGSKLIESGDAQWYVGRPVLVTQNDYSLKLMNGDIGICLSVPQLEGVRSGRTFRVAFPDGKGGIRWVLPSRLQSVETVFAMTVHKSQGSEFAHTALILPDKMNAVLTKELLYTGITRSKTRFTLLTPEQPVLERALRQKVSRASGLIH